MNTPNYPEQTISQPEPMDGKASGLDIGKMNDSEKMEPSPDAKEIVTNARDEDKSSLELQLLEAAETGRSEAVRNLLKDEKINMFTKDANGRTALHLASSEGHKEVVHELLNTSNRTEIINNLLSSKDDYDMTALHFASEGGYSEVIKELLNTGNATGIIDNLLTSKAIRGNTALHLASERGYKEAVQELLSRNNRTEIIINLLSSRDNNNMTSLHLASEGGYSEVVQELLKACNRTGTINEVLTSKANRGYTALHLALEHGHKEVAQELLNKNYGLTSDFLDSKDVDGKTALHLACIKRNEEVVKLLIDRHANLDIQSVDGETPLMSAIWESDVAIAKMLIDNKADHKKRSNNYSALTLASYCPKTDEIVRYLLEKGSDVNEIDPDGWAPIHTASWLWSEANLAVINLLIERGANLEAQNPSERTPLHLAIDEGDQEIIRLIIQKSKNVEIPDDQGLTALHVATLRQNEEAMKLLINKPARLDAKDKEGCTALHHAIRNEKSDASSCKSIVTLLLNGYAPINAVNANKETPLHWATIYGGLDIVQLILQRNPNVDAIDHLNETALHKVCRCRVKEDRAKITEELLKKASIGAKCDKGQTALHKASDAGCTEVVEALLNHRQDEEFIDAQDDSSFTPLHLASKSGHGNTVKALLDHGADVETRVRATSNEPDRTALALAVQSLLKNETEDDKKDSKAAISHIAAKSTESTKRNALYRAQMSLETEYQLCSVIEAMNPSDDRGDAYPKPSDLEWTEFIWCAIEPERHSYLLRKLKAKASILNENEVHLRPEEDCVLRWAAYHGYYVVVYWLLRKSEMKAKDGEASKRQKAIKITEGMLDLAKKNKEVVTPTPVEHSDEADVQTKQKKKGTRNVPASKERTQDQSTSDSRTEKIQRFRHTLDMLRDPPIGTDNGAISGHCEAPSLYDESNKESISRDHEATIVDFYSGGPRVDLFRRQRSVYEVIYETNNGGPDEVMKMATSILKEVNPGDSFEMDNDSKEDGPILRWIHFSANNVSS